MLVFFILVFFFTNCLCCKKISIQNYFQFHVKWSDNYEQMNVCTKNFVVSYIECKTCQMFLCSPACASDINCSNIQKSILINLTFFFGRNVCYTSISGMLFWEYRSDPNSKILYIIIWIKTFLNCEWWISVRRKYNIKISHCFNTVFCIKLSSGEVTSRQKALKNAIL